MSISEALEDWNPWWENNQVDQQLIGVERESLRYLTQLIDIPKIKIVVGVRRSGKSTLLYQIINHLISEKKIESSNIILLNFDDFRLSSIETEEIYKQYIETRKPSKPHIFLDEVHKAKNWVSLVRRLVDTKKGDVFLTDSSSYFIPIEYARILTGRKIQMELYPFSFREFLKFHNVKIQPYGTENRSLIRGYLRDYLMNGGFPEVQQYRSIWKRILLEYFEDIVTKDVVSRFGTDYNKTKDLALFLISNIGQKVTNRRIRGITGLGLETIEKYINYLEQVYFIFAVKRYSTKVREQILSPKKIYSIDTGLANIAGFKISENLGPLLENMIFIELKRRGYKVYYFQYNNKEVDFVVMQNNRIKEVINVSYTLQEEKTRKREINGLLIAMKALGLNRAKIITWDEKDTIQINGKTIEIKPAYEWLLEK